MAPAILAADDGVVRRCLMALGTRRAVMPVVVRETRRYIRVCERRRRPRCRRMTFRAVRRESRVRHRTHRIGKVRTVTLVAVRIYQLIIPVRVAILTGDVGMRSC